MGLMVELTIMGLRMAMRTTIPVTAFAVKVDKCNTLLTVIGATALLGLRSSIHSARKGTKLGRHPVLFLQIR
jgi:hypothetical protein